MRNKLIIITISTSMLFTSGCAFKSSSPAKDLPLVEALSEKEVIDYYKEALKYESIVERNIQVHEVTYELKEMSNSVKPKVRELKNAIEKELYSHTYKNSNMLSEQQYYYIKSIIDDKILTNGKIIKEAESLGYYFMDVEYDIAKNNTGKFLEKAQYLGIHGAFKKDVYGNVSFDERFIKVYDQKAAGAITIIDDAADNFQSDTIEYIDNQEENSTEQVRADFNNTYIDNQEENSTEQVRADFNNTYIGRKIQLDISTYNKLSGSSLNQTAFMPPLKMVYETNKESGVMSGFGIYPQGEFGLKTFEYNRNQLRGKLVLRFVFKQDILNKEKINFTGVYPVSISIDNKLEDVEQLVPDFVREEIEKIVERSDRAICNNDISALMSGNIYNDIGVAVLNGLYQNNTYLLRKISNVEKVIGRKDNYYLVQVVSVIQEGPRGTNAYGTYKDTYQMVIEQQDLKFIINDYVLIKRELIKEPQFELDSSIIKRLAALGLRGTISEESKEAIKELLNGLYQASTDRKLKGMYDSFNDDTTLLSNSHKEYLNSQLRGWLVRYGVNVKSTYKGIVTEWIGGADNQVELITEEIIIYEGQDTAQYMQMYYLVSNLNNKWVIDEMKALEIRDISGEELEQIKARIFG